jgi:hypothetical protein
MTRLPEDADALAGLAREVEGLRRRIEDRDGLAPQVAVLATVVADLAERLAVAPPVRIGPISWLGFPTAGGDPAAPRRAAAVLADLNAWVGAVHLRYTDAATALPECWLWHPDVVEELLWLRQAWASAYAGPAASVLAAGDWHERSRPGVVRRIRGAAGTCSLENHPAVASVTGSVDGVATWWTTDGVRPAPPRGRG